ncbi:hypothetical protein XI08_11345 [Bradyrhizobium sp. CCBAU 11361]|nr:hypothetical protein [Bradyrhizobium sp. CCBAU 11361]
MAAIGFALLNAAILLPKPPILLESQYIMLAASFIAGLVNVPARLEIVVVSEFSAADGSSLFTSPNRLPNSVKSDVGIADAVLATQIGNRNAGLMLLQNPDDLLFRNAAALHGLVLVWARTNFKPD